MSYKHGGKPYTRGSSSGGLPDGQWLHDKAPGAERTRVSRPTESRNPAQSGSKLLVDNLHYEVSEKDLASLFGKYGSLTKEPSIRYDRSGRSTGSATVLFDEQADAATALKALNGQLAKGQEMKIRYDTRPPGSRGGSGAGSLLARLDKGSSGSLASRISDKGNGTEQPSGTKDHSGGIGPHRNRGTRGRGGSRTRERPVKKDVTAEDLDKELEQYGAQGIDGPIAVQAGAADPVVPAPADEDVEMA